MLYSKCGSVLTFQNVLLLQRQCQDKEAPRQEETLEKKESGDTYMMEGGGHDPPPAVELGQYARPFGGGEGDEDVGSGLDGIGEGEEGEGGKVLCTERGRGDVAAVEGCGGDSGGEEEGGVELKETDDTGGNVCGGGGSVLGRHTPVEGEQEHVHHVENSAKEPHISAKEPHISTTEPEDSGKVSTTAATSASAALQHCSIATKQHETPLSSHFLQQHQLQLQWLASLPATATVAGSGQWLTNWRTAEASCYKFSKVSSIVIS